MARVKIAPSFLTADLARLADEVRVVEAAGADYLHLDVMDGHFVPPITFGSLVIAAIRSITTLPLDVHLMIEQPERHVEDFSAAGGDILNVHVEASGDIGQVLSAIRSLGKRAGVCINPETPITAITDLLHHIDQVIVMGVQPGWGGQPLLDGTLEKLRELRQLVDKQGLNVDLEIDGGVKRNNCVECVQAGASILVAGSVVFNQEASVDENMRALRGALAEVEGLRA
jgi:ribulose-phosphate 3-epimerase